MQTPPPSTAEIKKQIERARRADHEIGFGAENRFLRIAGSMRQGCAGRAFEAIFNIEGEIIRTQAELQTHRRTEGQIFLCQHKKISFENFRSSRTDRSSFIGHFFGSMLICVG